MKKGINLFVAFLVVSCQLAYGQKQKTEVLNLGTFHFAFYNRDVKKIEKKNQIDILDIKSQKEIENVVKRIALFRPTIIVIERNPELQSGTDSTYQSYLKGAHLLSRDESEQIGFRLAKRFGLKTLYCVNDWGMNYEYIDSILDGKDSTFSNKFWNYFYHHPDTAAMFLMIICLKQKGYLLICEIEMMRKTSKKIWVII